MLTPRASGAFVCRRCEVQLARPRLPALALALALARRPAPPAHASFSTTPHRRNPADEAEAPTSNGPPTITRVHRRKNKTVSQTTAKLGGLKQLGADADILVIRESIRESPRETQRNAEQGVVQAAGPELLHVPDIVAELRHERRAVTPEDICSQLESLRPRTDAGPGEPQHVSQTTFVKLVRILTEGFTAQQLSYFYSVAKNVHEENVYKDLLHGLKAQHDDAKHSLQRTDWHPGTTPLTKRLPGSGIGRKARRSIVSKPLLVDRILRDVWNLVLLEEIEAPGEIELTLKPWQLALLNAGDKETPLIDIGKSRRAKIEIHWEEGVLRITADKNTAEHAANDVESALRNTETKKLNLKPWTPRLAQDKLPKGKNLVALYTQQDFDTVASITRTNVQKLGDHQLVIRGLDKSSVEEAERTLISLLPLKVSAARTIDSRKLEASGNETYLLPTFDDGNSVDPAFRTTKLGRWLSPVARLSDSVPAQSKGHDGTAVEDPIKLDRSTSRLVDRAVTTLTQVQDGIFESTADSKETHESGYWSMEPQYKLSAEFGQVLFPFQSESPNEAVKAALSQTPQTPFWPVIPGLANLLTSESFETTARTAISALLYNFVPAPEQPNFEPGQTFPSLHIQVRASRHGGKANIHKISLGFQEHMHDVLLPDKASDIRFHRYGRLRFDKRADDKNIAEWTDAVRANIESGGRLTAPSLCIQVPNWLLSGHDSDAKGTRNVTYLFSGIQFRQTVTGSFMGTPISYSTVQAGKLGAKGGILTSYYDSESKDTSLRDETEIKAWVRKCLHIADSITEAGSKTVPVNKVLNPRREDSERKLRRAMIEEEGVATVESGDGTSVLESAENDAAKGDATGLNASSTIMEMHDQDQDQDQHRAASNENASMETTPATEDETIQRNAAEDTKDPSVSNILALDASDPSSESSTTDTTTENKVEGTERR